MYKRQRARDSDKDINLGSGTNRYGGVYALGTLWFINATSNMAEAYIASTRARDSDKDINLGSGSWVGGVSDGVAVWFTKSSSNVAVAYNASTRARDSDKDINLNESSSVYGGFSDGVTVWFIYWRTGMAVAYSVSTLARDSDKDINLGSTYKYQGCVSDKKVVWFINRVNSINVMAEAYDITSPVSETKGQKVLTKALAKSWIGGKTDAEVNTLIEGKVPQQFRNDADVTGQNFQPTGFWEGTQTQFDALTKTEGTLYFIA